MPETELGEVEGANEAVDRPNRIVRTDIVLDPRRKQTGLLAALAALERAIRHKPNRTCCSRKCPQFLPSLVGRYSSKRLGIRQKFISIRNLRSSISSPPDVHGYHERQRRVAVAGNNGRHSSHRLDRAPRGFVNGLATEAIIGSSAPPITQSCPVSGPRARKARRRVVSRFPGSAAAF